MSPLRAHDRLDKLADQIQQLQSTIVEREREAIDGSGDEAEVEVRTATAAMARVQLNSALLEHFDLSHQLLRATCPIHGSSAQFLGCPTCTRALKSRFRNPLSERRGSHAAE